MGAPTPAERVRGFVKRVVDVLPLPRGTDLSTLPLDVRWARAEKLSPDKKIAFVAQEVKTLLNLLSERVEEKFYTFSRERTGRLVVSQQEITQSKLQPPIKDYVSNPPVAESFYIGWPTYDPTLEVSTTEGYKTRHSDASTQFAISLTLTSSDRSMFGLTVGGVARKNSDYMMVSILPSWNSPSIRELQATNTYKNYQTLVQTGYADGFVAARELVRFAHDVLSARAQHPTPQAV